MQLMGLARLEHIKAGAVLFYVNGYTMSRHVEVICVSKRWEVSTAIENGKKVFDAYFECHPGNKLKKGKFLPEKVYFSDVGIDTRFGPAQQEVDEHRPEAMNRLFVSSFAAQDYVNRLKDLYPDVKDSTLIRIGEIKK